MAQPSAPATKKYSGCILGLLAVAAVATVICVIVLAINTSPTVSTETAAADPRMDLRPSIERSLGSSNRGVQRLTSLNFDDPEPQALFVQWAINDNLSETLIRHGARKDATDILEAIAASRIDYSYVIMSGSFPLSDQFGNANETNVVNLTFHKTTVDKVNWENFLSSNIYSIADEANVWTQFQGE